MKRTVSIPIPAPQERIFPLMEKVSLIFNAHVDWIIKNKSYRKTKIHKDLYYLLRDWYPEVPSSILQATRDQAIEAVKGANKRGDFSRVPRKKKFSGIRYNARTITLRGKDLHTKQLTLSCIGKRLKFLIKIPEYFQPIAEQGKFQAATLVWEKRKKRFKINLVFKLPAPAPAKAGRALGIDRGINNIAVTSDGEFFSSNQLKAARRRYLYNRRTLQAKGTRSAKRRLRRLSGREKRFSSNVNHVISKKLANKEGVSTFVLEDLTGIRKQKSKGKRFNKRLNNWPFYQLQLFLTYKAYALGKEVVFIDPRYTSQTCNQCGHCDKKNRKKSQFLCVSCGFREHADLNAAFNIRDRFLFPNSHESSHEQADLSTSHDATDLTNQVVSSQPRAVNS